ncbi:MAG: glycosyltransferase family 4 protein, partial [Acidobacteria bacterium]|nr:glycosyltransferase family 4 protein [Acidobacteriota bacterium]
FDSGPVVIPEAFRCGTPVIASDIGAMKELVELGKTGLRFDSSSDAALLDVLRWAVDHPEEMRTMGRNARMRYEGEFSSEAQYSRLSDIYAEAIEWRHRKDKP